MIRVRARLAAEQMKARLILQVHDELLIEAPEEEEARVRQILEEEMTGAASLAVRLEVDAHTGHTWYDAK
jgi:DNA polymerase-1